MPMVFLCLQEMNDTFGPWIVEEDNRLTSPLVLDSLLQIGEIEKFIEHFLRMF